MPDTTILAEQPVSVKDADGWLVRFGKRRRLGKGWIYDLRFYEDWHEAQANYEEPPGDWQAFDIWPCKEGRPYQAPLTYHTLAQLVEEARMDQ